MIPRIETIPSYADASSIREFVKSALTSIPEVLNLLKAATASTLVVVKPNWIQGSHEYLPDVWEPVITHPTVVISVVETLIELMSSRGTICVCDAPNSYASFDQIIARGELKRRMESLREQRPEMKLEFFDLRREVWIVKEEVIVERRRNISDPRSYVRLNLGTDSLFYGFEGEGRYYGADYDSEVVNLHHHGGTQEYLLAGTPMHCDLFVNLPKLKTHRKTGITCSLKNLVGINGDKNWLPHHTCGSPMDGGDEYAQCSLKNRMESALKEAGRKVALSFPRGGTWAYRKMRNLGKRALGESSTVIRNGNWHGNNTCWRMALDLNRALLYGKPDGTWREAGHPRHYLTIVDGIVGGEGAGPLCPSPVASGVLIAGTNPGAVDSIACKLMRFDPQLIPIVRESFARHRWPISMLSMEEVEVDDRRIGRTIPLNEVAPAVPAGFEPHFGWANLRGKV